MSSPEINQVLAQMRMLQAQASQTAPAAQESSTAFSDLLGQSINAVNNLQQEAGQMTQAFESGEKDVDLAQVMIAVQKSNVAFQGMMEVRNKLVEAYRDVMNMPI